MILLFDALGRLMQLAAKRMGNEGLHTFGAEAISLLWRLATHPVSAGQGQDLSRRENEKCRQKCRPNENNQPPIQPPNQPTSQKTKTLSGGSALFWLQAQAIMAKKEDEKMEDYIDRRGGHF
jgi:hypothetical protein